MHMLPWRQKRTKISLSVWKGHTALIALTLLMTREAMKTRKLQTFLTVKTALTARRRVKGGVEGANRADTTIDVDITCGGGKIVSRMQK